MKKEEWSQGLSHIDDDLIEEFVAKKKQLSAKAKNTPTPHGSIRFRALLPVAAVLLMVSMLTVSLLLPMNRPDPPLPPVDGTEGEESTTGTTPPSSGEQTTTQTEPTLPPEGGTTGDSTTETVPSYSADLIFFSIRDYTHYQKWIKTADIPDNFIRYEQIKDFGEFYHFTVHSAGDNLSVYHYLFLIQGTNSLLIMVEPYEVKPFAKYEGTVPQNLRQIEQKEGAYALELNGIGYFFVQGKLSTIFWKQGSNRVVMYVDEIIDLPASDLPPLLAALLDSTTAADALASIKKSINTPFTEFFTTVEDTTIADTIISIEEPTTVEENTTTAGGNQSEPKGGCSGSVISSLVVLFIVGCAGALVYKKDEIIPTPK